MSSSMAAQLAITIFIPGVHKPGHTGAAAHDNIHIKIDEMGMVGAVPLRIAYSVRVMAAVAWCVLFNDMLVMVAERLIIQDGIPAVAGIAKGIIFGRLCRII